MFFFIHFSLYLFIISFHAKVPFHTENYLHNAYHYLQDPRLEGGQFQLLRALGQYDAQWYLRIADNGYPSPSKHIQDGMTYAFFPLYPFIVRSLNVVLHNIETSAFLLANILLVINFVSLLFIVKSFTSKLIALKTTFFLFLFPFSIFFRSYFAESLFLFLLLWFTYFLMKRSWAFSAFCLSLLTITKGNGILLNIFFLYLLLRDVKKGNMSKRKALGLLCILVLPFLSWLLYNFSQTGNLLYFYTVRSAWTYSFPFYALLHNLANIFSLPSVPLHSFHASQIDAIAMLVSLILVVKSKKALPFELWMISLVLFVTPFAIQYMMGFARSQIFSFPLFLYLAHITSIKMSLVLLTLFMIGLFLVSLFFVNWYWI